MVDAASDDATRTLPALPPTSALAQSTDAASDLHALTMAAVPMALAVWSQNNSVWNRRESQRAAEQERAIAASADS